LTGVDGGADADGAELGIGGAAFKTPLKPAATGLR
jgi:hypothetical protein